MKRVSFVPYSRDCVFPIENLPYGVFTHPKYKKNQIGVAIGERILNLTALEELGVLSLSHRVFDQEVLNPFMNEPVHVWRSLREELQELLSSKNKTLQQEKFKPTLSHKQDEVQMKLPVAIGDYTDFYASIDHAKNVGSMFRDKNNPLLPNWKHLPVGYHGRASSIVVSGTEIKRPCGQTNPKGDDCPVYGPTSRLDFELEMGVFIGGGTSLGQSLTLEEAQEHIFGFVLVNDWSARDIQKWEYVPLGPFVSKSFATSISPWVVPQLALEPFYKTSSKQSPAPLGYLLEKDPKRLDVNLKVELKIQSQKSYTQICATNSKYLYWSFPQQISHHTVTGCPLRTGDLMASGTISGPEVGGYGSMLELAWNGTQPIDVQGELRSFIHDGDSVRMSGCCYGEDYVIGFGSLENTIKSATPLQC
jgi:fumarylacetoacetase